MVKQKPPCCCKSPTGMKEKPCQYGHEHTEVRVSRWKARGNRTAGHTLRIKAEEQRRSLRSCSPCGKGDPSLCAGSQEQAGVFPACPINLFAVSCPPFPPPVPVHPGLTPLLRAPRVIKTETSRALMVKPDARRVLPAPLGSDRGGPRFPRGTGQTRGNRTRDTWRSFARGTGSVTSSSRGQGGREGVRAVGPGQTRRHPVLRLAQPSAGSFPPPSHQAHRASRPSGPLCPLQHAKD